MSATATFELPPDIDLEDLREAVRQIWTDDSVDLLVGRDGRVTMQLCWYIFPKQQAHELHSIARLLLQRLEGRPLFYIRDEAAYDPNCPDYPRPISVDELITEEFAPAMHNSGIPYRYLIRESAA